MCIRDRISTPYEFEGRIPLAQAIPLGLQHVMAMFIGNLTPLIIVMGLCGLTADAGYGALRTALLQNAMIMAGIVTLVQMFSIGPVGGKVPIVMGTSSGFLGVLNNTVAACGGGIDVYKRQAMGLVQMMALTPSMAKTVRRHRYLRTSSEHKVSEASVLEYLRKNFFRLLCLNPNSEISRFILTLQPVSYTHLDVYKRQV